MFDARAYLEDLRESAARACRIATALRSMSNDESWRAGLPIAVRGGGKSDPTASRAMLHVNSAASMRSDLESLAPAIHEGRKVCEGVADALGDNYGLTLFYRYLQGRAWKDVAKVMGCSERICYLRRDVAVDYLDSVGLARVKHGRGITD